MNKPNKTKDMTKGNAVGLIVRFALPLMIGNAFQQLYTITDAAIVGQGLGLNALAAVGTVDWPIWIFFGLLTGATEGYSIIAAQVFGAGNIKELKNARAMAEILAVVMSVLSVIVGLAIRTPVLEWLNVPQETYDMSRLYMTVIICGLPCYMFYNFYAGLLRAVGNSRTPFLAIVIASITNIILDSIAVFVLKMGVLGAALATVCSQFLSGLICFIAINRIDEYRYSRKDIELYKDNAWRLFRMGFPISLQNVAVSIGGVYVTSIVNSFGKSHLLGITVGNKCYGVMEIVALSFSFAVTSYVGQNYGAKRMDRVREGIKKSSIIALIISVVIGAAVVILRRQLALIFISTEDPVEAEAALKIATTYLTFMGSFLPVLYMLYMLRAALMGLGDTKASVYSALIALSTRIGCATLGSVLANQMLVIWAEYVDWTAAFAVILIMYFARIKKIEGQGLAPKEVEEEKID